jgi:hypothetical protein
VAGRIAREREAPVKPRKLMITLLIIVLLVVYYMLGTGYLKLREENDTLASEITSVTGNLTQIPTPPADLEQRLTTAQADLDAAVNSFPIELNTTVIVNYILELADDIGVKVIPLVTQPWTIESYNDYNYSVFRLNVTVTGTSAQLVSFLRQLENGEVQTLIMVNLSVNKENEASAAESISEGTTQINASLDIAIYAQSPVNWLEGKDI